MSAAEEEEAKYFSKDFEWETLKQEIESNPSYQHHLFPFIPGEEQTQPSLNRDSTAWQRFHIRHSSGKFFKERRYLLKEFPELLSARGGIVLEVGCGNGSSVVPILRGNKDIVVYACDCSNETLERAREIVESTNLDEGRHRFRPFCCDFASTGFPKWLAYDKESTVMDSDSLYSLQQSGCSIGGVDFVTMIFTLSAVPFKRMPSAILECFSVLKPGGLLLFRDYGLYDMTMLRFESDKRVGFREYMRSDGTRSYFFCLDTVREIFAAAGFVELELEYCCVISVNRQKGKSMRRVWVHGKFQKPL